MPALWLALSMAASCAVAQEPGAPPPLGDRTRDDLKEGVTRLLLTNESFLKKAVRANQTEVDLAQLALEKSRNPGIRDFSARMVKDHGEVLNELRTIARDKGIALPPNNTHTDNATRKLRGLSGEDFDKAYASIARQRHDQALTLFNAAADDQSLDPDLRRFAEQTLPLLRDHQHEAGTLPGHDHASAAGL